MLSLLMELELLGWSARCAQLAGDVVGLCDWERRVVWIDERLSYECMRSTLAHEIRHVRRGPNPDPTEEGCCEAEAAARLVPLPLLALATRYTQDEEAIAVLLGVDVGLLQARVAGLTRGDVADLLRYQREQNALMVAGVGLPQELVAEP